MINHPRKSEKTSAKHRKSKVGSELEEGDREMAAAVADEDEDNAVPLLGSVKAKKSLGFDAEVNEERVHQRRRKCDEELEQQLAMAMTATAFESQSKRTEALVPNICEEQCAGDLDMGGRRKQGEEVAGVKRTSSSFRNNASSFDTHLGDIGKYWVEVYCGSTTIGTDVGRWVPVDPFTGCIDRAADVEDNCALHLVHGAPHSGSGGGIGKDVTAISYVVAFAGGGGAKDVTRRYTSSFIAAERQREGEWWDETLRPLRSKEVSALHEAALWRTGGTAAVTHAGIR